MAAHRKHPPSTALAEIERLASKGHSTVGLAKFFGVARSVVMRWFEEDQRLEEAYEQGRDSYRQALEEQIVSMTLASKIPTGLIYLLKAKFKMYDQPSSSQKIDVAVNTAPPVLVVRSHGSDEQWAALCAEQQRKLTQPEPAQTALPDNSPVASAEPDGDGQPISIPAALPAGVYARPW